VHAFVADRHRVTAVSCPGPRTLITGGREGYLKVWALGSARGSEHDNRANDNSQLPEQEEQTAALPPIPPRGGSQPQGANDWTCSLSLKSFDGGVGALDDLSNSAWPNSSDCGPGYGTSSSSNNNSGGGRGRLGQLPPCVAGGAWSGTVKIFNFNQRPPPLPPPETQRGQARADAAARRAAADQVAKAERKARRCSSAVAGPAAAAVLLPPVLLPDEKDQKSVGELTFDPKTLNSGSGSSSSSSSGQASVSSVCSLGTTQDPETGQVGPARIAAAVRSNVCVWHLERPDN